MASQKPFFSIVMPTRNRADLLVHSAMESVLNQTFNDFEIVIFDNASTDNTKEQIERIKDTRIKYVRSKEWIPKERSFEFAFNEANGEFAMIFCDDDYLTTTALEKAHNVLSKYNTDLLVYSPACTYHYPDWYEPSRRNLLRIPPFSGKLLQLDSAAHLQMVFERIGLLTESPMVSDIFIRTSFIKSLMDKYGTIFPHGHMGDYNMTCYTLSNTQYYLYLDEPLTVFGHWKEGSSAQLYFFKTTMPEYKEWIDWFTANYLMNMPVKTYQWCNCIAATLIDMKNRLNIPYDINIINYFNALTRELVYLELLGVDVSIQKEGCYKGFATLPLEIQHIILKTIEKGPKFQAQNIFKVLEYSMQSPKIVEDELVIKGDLYGINSIKEAGEFFDRFLTSSDTMVSSSTEIDETTNNYIEGITNIAKRYNRICIIGTDNIITRTTAKLIGSKVVCVADVNFLLKGKEILPGLRISTLDSLSNADFNCVIITHPDTKLDKSAPYKSFSEYVKKVIKDGKSKNATVLRFNDIVQLGNLIMQIKNGDKGIVQIIDNIIKQSKDLA